MKLTDEQKTELEDYAGRLLKKREICIIMDLDHNEFLQDLEDMESDVYISYMKGLLATKAKVRKSVVDLASSGSSPAQSMAERFLVEIELENFEFNGSK